MKVDRSRLVDAMNRPLTQSLFLEVSYNDFAVYSLKDEDCEWNGKEYPSLKRLYLETMDVTEYEFATKYLLGWRHWQRICANKMLLEYVEEWRMELEVKLRSEGVRQLRDAAKAGHVMSAKWLAERGWDTRPAGRPSKDEMVKEKAIQQRITDEFAEDIQRMQKH